MSMINRGFSTASWRNPAAAAAAADSPLVAWQTLDLSAGTVYGTSAVVTSRTATSLTIDPSQNAAAYLDNSPDNRGDFWWSSQSVDLGDWPADTPALLLAEVVRGDSAPSHGTLIGVCLHNTADPTASTAFSGVWIRRKINTDADCWGINSFGQVGGYSGMFSKRQRNTMLMMIGSNRLEALSYRSRFLDKDGVSQQDAQTILTSATAQPFDVTGGLWVSVIAGSYQPAGTPDAASAHTPRGVRFAVVPYGENL